MLLHYIIRLLVCPFVFFFLLCASLGGGKRIPFHPEIILGMLNALYSLWTNIACPGLTTWTWAVCNLILLSHMGQQARQLKAELDTRLPASVMNFLYWGILLWASSTATFWSVALIFVKLKRSFLSYVIDKSSKKLENLFDGSPL